ncbi:MULTISPECIES: hypothetical protein [unclassified Bradyrhizobium]|uniref:hypothetical protein n=1 Tax=unclassified Bradyrhizobium TaxID=2631580 RepID=UPI001BA6A021|nr:MULTISPECIES: hypothetical protein [unclassified Bradyrhizobium]MBR1224332.1 hypothetical protein [Bradyrhizobium sp. AUGA SZCCT0176]MBR1297834.1 hypothetical protein [Bradyrhizobium sp. AUGA SZCCT0042]
MRIFITMAGIALAFTLVTPASQAAESFDGLWARTAKDYRNKEGPDSKTLIDMSKPIGGKPAPMVDQYENHCRIDRKTAVGDGINLSVTCFEFWDYFNKGVEPRKATVKLAPGPNGTIKINGKPYLRCKAGSGAAKR